MNHWHEHFNVLVGWFIQVVFIGQVVTFGHVNEFASWSSHGIGTGEAGAANELCEIPTNRIPIERIATAIDSDSQPVKAIIRFIRIFPFWFHWACEKLNHPLESTTTIDSQTDSTSEAIGFIALPVLRLVVWNSWLRRSRDPCFFGADGFHWCDRDDKSHG